MPGISPHSKLKIWLQAARLRTLPLSLSGIITGGAMAFDEGYFRPAIFGMALLTTVLLQLTSNFANDLGDARKGTDHAGRIGPQRTVQSGLLSGASMRTAILQTSVLAFLSGLLLLYFAFVPGHWTLFLTFLVIGTAAIAAALLYTLGERPYGYSGKGDVFVMLFFGFVAVSGSYFLFTMQLSAAAFLQSITIGSFATCVLHLNNMRDRLEDEKSGKITLAVRFGKKASRRYFLFLVVLMNFSSLFAALLYENHLSGWIFVLSLIPGWVICRRVFTAANDQVLNNYLKPMALSAFAYATLLFIGSML